MKTPSHFELYQSVRKAPVRPSQVHKKAKGRGSYDRKAFKKIFD